MTPEQLKEFEDMKRRLELLERVENVAFFKSLERRLASTLTLTDGADSTGTTISVRNAADTGSETVADNYGGVLTLTDARGNTYRIGYYT
jgi:hypothetical protein